MRVAVFCSCSELASPFLFDEMESLGRALAGDGHVVVYGGSSGGCMGALARGVQEAGGQLIGVIPRSQVSECREQEGLTQCHFVDDLMTRKDMMNDLAEAFVIFPGGLGTLDEAFTVMTLKAVGHFDKPIVFYNFMDIWTPVLQALEILTAQRLIRCQLGDLIVTLDKVDAVRDHLKHVAAPQGS